MNNLIKLFSTLGSLALLSACAPGAPDFSKIPAVDLDFDCETSNFPAIPEDPRLRGPWQVGAKTVVIPDGKGKDLITEIWYPAKASSQRGRTPITYDLRYALPNRDAAKVPDGSPLVQECDCYRDLPIDDAHGQFPVILYVHGTAGFRTASLAQAAHWASRGFVVVNADNPNIQLKDVKANFLAVGRATQSQDTVQLLKALHELPENLRFLEGHLDLRRVGVSGHSAGGNVAAIFGDAPGVRTIIPMAAGGVSEGEYLRTSMVLAGTDDGIVNYSQAESGFARTPGQKRFGGINNAGHLAYTELCFIGREFGGVIPLVESFGIDVPSFFLSLGTDGCGDSSPSPEAGWEVINYLSTAAFEETLQCSASATDYLSRADQELDILVDYQEVLQ